MTKPKRKYPVMGTSPAKEVAIRQMLEHQAKLEAKYPTKVG